MRVIGSILLLIGMAGAVFAGSPVPEVGPASAAGAAALIAGAVLVMRGRRKK